MDSTLRQRLIQLTHKCQTLSQTSKYTQCIQIMQQILTIKKQVYGMQHPQFATSSQKLCQYLNLSSMIYLQKQQFNLCKQHLRKAEIIAHNSLQMKATTYNNLACYYRRIGKIRTALTYLIQALQLQLKLQEPKTLADTHLNLCAVLSQLDRHQDALQHSMLSIILLQDQFLAKLMHPPYAHNNNSNERQQQSPNDLQPTHNHKIDDQRLAVLAIAYHNMGVEFQHLKRFQQAVKIYNKALTLSSTYLPQNQQLILNLTKVVQSATQQIQDRKKSHHQIKKQCMDRQFSQTKHNIYKEFAKQTERNNKNLPKLKFSKDQFLLKEQYQQRDNSYDRGGLILVRENNNIHRETRENIKDDYSMMQRVSRSFASRKHPRYYKSYAVTPQNNTTDSRTLLLSQQSNQRGHYHQGSVPVSDGLKDFNPI